MMLNPIFSLKFSPNLFIQCSTGIIFSVFVNRYGCRIVVIVGGLTWFVGFGLSSLATSIGVLYVTYGIVAGAFSIYVTLMLYDQDLYEV